MEKLPVPATTAAPSSAFTGSVLVEALRGPLEGSALAMAHVHFAPGARTHWHTHPRGQTLHGTAGVGLVVTRAGEVHTLEPGRTVWIPPLEEHWHGAMAGTRMAHIAAQEADEDGETVTWLDPVTDEEFSRANEAARQG
jgi:quercetin dioxygenase-like cupin family protein